MMGRADKEARFQGFPSSEAEALLHSSLVCYSSLKNTNPDTGRRRGPAAPGPALGAYAGADAQDISVSCSISTVRLPV